MNPPFEPDLPLAQDSEPSLEESVRVVLRRLPAPVREFLTSSKQVSAVDRVRLKYQLHVDQAAILERELTLLLMGLEDSQEFTTALVQEAQIPSDSIRQVISDLNAEVFAPLHVAIRGAAPAPQASPRPVPPPPAYRSAAPAPSAPAQTMPMRPQPQPVPRPAPMPSQSMPTVPQFRPNVGAPLPPKTAMPGAAPSAPAAPRPVPPVPQNLPGAMPGPAQEVKPEGAFPRTYLVDPYREPPE